MLENVAELLSSSAGQLEPDSSAEQPAGAITCKVGCWNVGWNYTSKIHSTAQLADELWRVWQLHDFDAFGLSEIFEVDYTNSEQLQKVNERRKTILEDLLRFNVA